MKPKISIVCLCLMSVFLIGSLAYPAELPGRVLGIVTDESGIPIAGAKVVLDNGESVYTFYMIMVNPSIHSIVPMDQPEEENFIPVSSEYTPPN